MKKDAYDDKVNKFLRKFTSAYIVEELFRPLDDAYMAFEGKFTTTASYDALLEELRRFEVFIFNRLIPGYDEFAKKEPKSFVKKGIENMFHPLDHYYDTQSGKGGGVRHLLDNYISKMKSSLLKTYITDSLYNEFEIKDSRDKFKFMESFCREVGYDYDHDPLYYFYDYDKVLYDYLQAKLHLYKHVG